MSFTQQLSAGVKRHMKSLKAAHTRHVKAVEKRADAKLARAKTQLGRDKIRLQLAKERAHANRELLEAQTATKRAKTALQKAKREAGDIGVGERISRGIIGAGKAINKMGGNTGKRRTKGKTKSKSESINHMLWG